MAATQLVAKALLLNTSNQFLLLTRSDTHPRLGGFYDLPGGAVERGEEPGHAMLREIAEETGLQLTSRDIDVLYATTMIINERNWPTLLYVARAHGQTENIQLSYEHKAYDWAPLDRLAEVEPQLAPTYREIFEYLRENNILADLATSSLSS